MSREHTVNSWCMRIFRTAGAFILLHTGRGDIREACDRKCGFMRNTATVVYRDIRTACSATIDSVAVAVVVAVAAVAVVVAAVAVAAAAAIGRRHRCRCRFA